MGTLLNINLFEYPFAAKPNRANNGVLKSCLNCKQKILISRWDSWNDFLVRCPFCNEINGERWNKKTVLWASFLFQPLSFFFTLRPFRAIVFILIYLLIAFIGNYILSLEILNILVEVLGAFLFLAFPMIVNGVLLTIHNHNCGILIGRKELGVEIVETATDLFS